MTANESSPIQQRLMTYVVRHFRPGLNHYRVAKLIGDASVRQYFRYTSNKQDSSILAAYLLDLARALHSSYKELRVKGEEEKLASARLLLFAVVKNILAGGMKILGIRPLEKM